MIVGNAVAVLTEEKWLTCVDKAFDLLSAAIAMRIDPKSE
jgi:hypothetical protein